MIVQRGSNERQSDHRGDQCHIPAPSGHVARVLKLPKFSGKFFGGHAS